MRYRIQRIALLFKVFMLTPIRSLPAYLPDYSFFAPSPKGLKIPGGKYCPPFIYALFIKVEQ